MAVVGAAHLGCLATRAPKPLAFEEQGMEAIYEFEVVDMPVTAAFDSTITTTRTASSPQPNPGPSTPVRCAVLFALPYNSRNRE